MRVTEINYIILYSKTVTSRATGHLPVVDVVLEKFGGSEFVHLPDDGHAHVAVSTQQPLHPFPGV